MKYFSLEETDGGLTLILDEISSTQTEIVITRNGVPVARISPWQPQQTSTHHYPLRELPISISEDFDAPIPELWDALGE